MAKSLLLLLCCAFSFQGLWAQDQRTADEQLRTDAAIPQKLEFRKADIGWASHPNYFAKKTETGDDDVRSILYRPVRQDRFQLDLPRLKNNKVDFHANLGRREPLFREQ